MLKCKLIDYDCCPQSLSLTDLFEFQVEGNFYVNDALEKLMFEELRNACRGGAAISLNDDPDSSSHV